MGLSRGGNVGIEIGTFLEHMVERELANLGAHRSLCQLRDGIFGILYTIATACEQLESKGTETSLPGLVCIKHTRV